MIEQVTSPCPYHFTMQILSICRILKGKWTAHQNPLKKKRRRKVLARNTFLKEKDKKYLGQSNPLYILYNSIWSEKSLQVGKCPTLTYNYVLMTSTN